MRHITFIVLICKNDGVCNILLPKDQKIKGTQYLVRGLCVHKKRDIKIYIIMCYGLTFKEL